MNISIRIKQTPSQKWIGLVHVKPRPKNDALGDAIGAFVSAIAVAESGADFAQKVTAVLGECGFDVVGIQDVEVVQKRLRMQSVKAHVIALAEQITEENPVALGTFHSYET